MMMLNAYSWLCLIAILLILEAVTTNFVTIWFAFGAFAALLTSFATGNPVIQSTVFILVSAAMVVATLPFVKKMRAKKNHTPLNADRNLGRSALVIAAIAPGENGRVRLDGVDWSACSATPLAVGETCRVCAINSTVLTVEAATQSATL